MKTRTLTVVMAVCFTAVLIGTAQGGDPAKKAKLDELYKKLDDLSRQMYAPFSGGRGGFSREGFQRRRELSNQVNQVKQEIIRLSLDPNPAARYDLYVKERARIRTEMSEAYRDRDLDRSARRERLAEINKRQAALDKQYADVLGKVPSFDRYSYQRYAQFNRIDRLKGQLKASDEEWAVLEPRLSEILRLQGELRAARAGRTGSTVRSFGPAQVVIQRSVGARGESEGGLGELLRKEDASVADIRARMDALRKARAEQAAKATDLEQKLKAARQQLRELLTVRQEAVLLVENVLD